MSDATPLGIAFLDVDNILRRIGGKYYYKGNYLLEAGVEGMLAFLAGIANFETIFAFGPENAFYGITETLHKYGIYIVNRPKIMEVLPNSVSYQDTTDQGMIDLMNFHIERTSGLEYLCCGSGDAHFAPSLEKAAEKGIKIAVIATRMALSAEVHACIDMNPRTGQKMLHYFSPMKIDGE